MATRSQRRRSRFSAPVFARRPAAAATVTVAGAMVFLAAFAGTGLTAAASHAVEPDSPAAATTGLLPIVDLGTGTYLGYPGGLYPGGLNTPPAAHLTGALQHAGSIVPRNSGGAPDPDGWIAMLAVGMSNTTHEFGAFERLADADVSRNARVVLLDTGLGGQTAAIIADPSATYWTTLQQRLTAMGLTAAQVQAAWVKEADAQPPANFPVHAQTLRDELRAVANNLHDKFPNLALCYLSSRIYGGYSAPGTLNPEPQAYESGFSVKWLIEDQIGGDPNLNYGQLAGAVRSPLLLWGPYLWADGTNPRSDGLVWRSQDLEADHVHPSPSGEAKVAGMLANFFATDPTAASWWPRQPGSTLIALDATHDAYVSAASPATNFGFAPVLLEQGGAQPVRSYLRFDVTGITGTIALAKLSLRVTSTDVGGGIATLVNDTSWNEGAITYANAPAIGTNLVSMPQSSRDGTIAANVTAAVRNDADRQLSFALTSPATALAAYHSKEAAHAPRLILTVLGDPTEVPEPATVDAGTTHVQLALSNPFRPGAAITYQLPAAGRVVLAVHDVAGRRRVTLVDAVRPAGLHATSWNGRDSRGAALGSGVYFVQATFQRRISARKIVLAP